MAHDRISRRAFLGATAGTLGCAAIPNLCFARSLPVDIRRFGAVGDGIHDDSEAFATALRTLDNIYVPAGIYLVDRILIPAGRTVFTDGFRTVFQQQAGIVEEIRILNITGSNVRVGDCTVRGNIRSDPGEQRHGILIQANRRTGNLSNVVIGNVRGSELRGDVVYIGSRDGCRIDRVRVGSVRGSNVLRNVVSIVGGRDIAVGAISANAVGMTHLDIEPDAHNGPVIGCSIESVHGGFVQVAGQTAQSYVDKVRIELLNLRAPVARSVPHYQPGISRSDALTIRNVRSLEIGHFGARGFDGHAIRQIWNPGALSNQNLFITTAEISDCARDRRTRAYVRGSRHATTVRIGTLTLDAPRPGIDLAQDCKELTIGTLRR